MDESNIDANFKKNGFIKYKNEHKKIIINLYNKKENNSLKTYEYPFESNVINKIPETDIFFIIGICKSNMLDFKNKTGDFIHFFTKKYQVSIPSDFDSPTRTFFKGITDTYGVYRFMFDYQKKNELKINVDDNYYYIVTVH